MQQSPTPPNYHPPLSAHPLQGLCFDCQLLDPGRIPMAEHDVPMDAVVTPSRVINVAAAAAAHSAAGAEAAKG